MYFLQQNLMIPQFYFRLLHGTIWFSPLQIYIVSITIPAQVIKYKKMYNQCCSRWISQSDCSIHSKLNY